MNFAREFFNEWKTMPGDILSFSVPGGLRFAFILQGQGCLIKGWANPHSILPLNTGGDGGDVVGGGSLVEIARRL